MTPVPQALSSGAAALRGHAARAGTPAAEIGVLAIALLLVQLLPADIWRGGLLLLALVAGLAWMNARRFPGGALCWPTIFLVVLALFHLGYYVAVYHDLAPTVNGMPELEYSAGIDKALQLFATACVAFELGAVTVLAFLSRRRARPASEQAVQSRAFFNLGVLVTAASLVLFVVYLWQIGWIDGLRRLNYTTYVTFLQSSDPRFAALSITYLPAGLLLLYAFIDRSDPRARRRIWAILVAFAVFTLWLLWVGNRGAALLDWAALLYIHHVRVRPLPVLKLLAIGVAIALVIGPVRQIRELTPASRGEAVSDLDYNPMQAVTEMGLTFRPYLAFIQHRDEGTSLGIEPYRSALAHVPPRLGVEGVQQTRSEGYVRSNAWITQRVDPVYASAGYGLGGSAIGEPYVAFGTAGVICAFVLLGFLIALIEWRAVALRSAAAMALVPLVFYGVNFYVRDDAYGLLRILAWGLAAVLVTSLVARATARREARSVPRVGPRTAAA